MGEGKRPIVNFEYSRKEELWDLADDEEIKVSHMFQQVSDAILDDEVFRKYVLLKADESDYSLAEFIEDELDLNVQDELPEEEAYTAIDIIIGGYFVENDKMVREGFYRLGDLFELDLGEYADESIEQAYYRMTD